MKKNIRTVFLCLFFLTGCGQQIIKVIDIGEVMFAMMKPEGLSAQMRSKGIRSIIEWG